MTPPPHPLAPEIRLVTTRDLALLIASLALVIAPHTLRAPWWLTLLTLCLYAWRMYYSLNRAPLPSRWLVIGVTAVAMLGVWMEYRTLFGRQPGILLLMLFSGLKVLETRTHRDAAAAAFLGYFLIITNFLYTQAIPTALLMGAALFTITWTLIGFSAPNRAPRANLRTAALLLAHAAPAALVLFLLFPRVQGPLWGLPQDAYANMSGLSETMSPGSLASLALSEAIAFRAEFEGDSPPPPLRYWRGPVLWDFDGRTWHIGSQVIAPFIPPAGGRATYRYGVVLEPHNRNWLFALETAASVPDNSRHTTDGQILLRSLVRSRLRYDMSSMIAPSPRLDEPSNLLRRALLLPQDFNPRSVALAAQWRAAAKSDDEVLRQALAFLRQGRYTYTLEPPLLGQDSVDEFLFATKSGFCEHFASAFVFLMRAAGCAWIRPLPRCPGGSSRGLRARCRRHSSRS
jgi:protein-glutamine gamma-glutamyltransferase